MTLKLTKETEELSEKLKKERAAKKEKTDNKYPIENTDKIVANNENQIKTNKQINTNWTVIGSSVIGKSHVEKNIPCQDSNFYDMINDKWGIAIVSDGAGSESNSHIGSKFVVEKAFEIFSKTITEKKWSVTNKLPSEKEWKEMSVINLANLRHQLQNFADSNNYIVESLSATVIIVVFSPVGLLVTHIGDGRAGYCTLNNEWKSMISPYNGEQANATVFLTSDIWQKDKISQYVESNIVSEPVKAFTLMSDGGENACYEVSKWDEVIQKWSDPNKPYPNFFNPVINRFKKMKETGKSQIDLEEYWENFLESGFQILKDESDDKTIVVGFTE